MKHVQRFRGVDTTFHPPKKSPYWGDCTLCSPTGNVTPPSRTAFAMKIRRCAHLFVELDQEPRFDFSLLLSGGDGLDRSTRWRAYAPHLSEPVQVTLSHLQVLEACDREEGCDLAELSTRFGESEVKSLCDSGLLLRCGSQERDSNELRDTTLREVAWWPIAAIAQWHGTWVDVDIEARNEAGLMLTSEQMVGAFGESPEPEYWRRKRSTSIPVATPLRTKFDELLANRKTCRNFDTKKSVSADDLATMLHRVWGAIGTLELAPGAVAVKKYSPAGGGLHAVEAYLLAQRVEGLAPGLYHYLSLEHGLEMIRSLDSQEAASYAHRFVAGQNWFENVPVMVIMTARFDRLFWKYRRHTKAWRVVHLDVGHLSQTMYLSAADLGLGAFVTAAINDGLIEEMLELTPMREGAIAIVGFGPRAATKTTLELDDLTPTAASLAAAARRADSG